MRQSRSARITKLGNRPDRQTRASRILSDPVRLKHLDFLQAIIARQAGNSFLIKGWSLTVAAGFFGFAIKDYDWRLAALALMPSIGFWWLDGFFLRQERMYRCLYMDVVRIDSPIEPFDLSAERYKMRSSSRWPKVLFSHTLRTFYGVVVLSAVILSLTLAFSPTTQAERELPSKPQRPQQSPTSAVTMTRTAK